MRPVRRNIELAITRRCRAEQKRCDPKTGLGRISIDSRLWIGPGEWHRESQNVAASIDSTPDQLLGPAWCRGLVVAEVVDEEAAFEACCSEQMRTRRDAEIHRILEGGDAAKVLERNREERRPIVINSACGCSWAFQT